MVFRNGRFRLACGRNQAIAWRPAQRRYPYRHVRQASRHRPDSRSAWNELSVPHYFLLFCLYYCRRRISVLLACSIVTALCFCALAQRLEYDVRTTARALYRVGVILHVCLYFAHACARRCFLGVLRAARCTHVVAVLLDSQTSRDVRRRWREYRVIAFRASVERRK